MTDPYRVGLDVLSQTGSELDERRNRAAEVAPDFMRLALGFTYGEIFARPDSTLNCANLPRSPLLRRSDDLPRNCVSTSKQPSMSAGPRPRSSKYWFRLPHMQALRPQ